MGVVVAQLEVEEGEDVGAFDGDGAVGVDGAELLGDVGGGEVQDRRSLVEESHQVTEGQVGGAFDLQIEQPAAQVRPELCPRGVAESVSYWR